MAARTAAPWAQQPGAAGGARAHLAPGWPAGHFSVCAERNSDLVPASVCFGSFVRAS